MAGVLSAVEMTGVKAAMKMQHPVKGFFTAINRKLDMSYRGGH
jgi:glycine cleavage system H lipoate-binding protein